jgi:hypothetical protein
LEGWFPLIKILQNLVTLLRSRIELERIAQWMKNLRTWSSYFLEERKHSDETLFLGAWSHLFKELAKCVTYQEFGPFSLGNYLFG